MDGTNLGNLTGINKSTGNEFTITSSWDGLSAHFSIYKSDAQVGNLFEVTREKHDHTGNTCVWFIIEIVSGANAH